MKVSDKIGGGSSENSNPKVILSQPQSSNSRNPSSLEIKIPDQFNPFIEEDHHHGLINLREMNYPEADEQEDLFAGIASDEPKSHHYFHWEEVDRYINLQSSQN